MTDDLVQRLRYNATPELVMEAADRIAALEAAPVTEQDFINFFIRNGCTGMSVAEVAKTVLREYELTPRGEAATQQEPKCYCHVLPNGYGKCPVCKAADAAATLPPRPESKRQGRRGREHEEDGRRGDDG